MEVRQPLPPGSRGEEVAGRGRLVVQRVVMLLGSFGRLQRRATLQGAASPARTQVRCAGRQGEMARAGLGRCHTGEKGGKNGSPVCTQ
jgi:hypothetical protein